MIKKIIVIALILIPRFVAVKASVSLAISQKQKKTSYRKNARFFVFSRVVPARTQALPCPHYQNRFYLYKNKNPQKKMRVFCVSFLALFRWIAFVFFLSFWLLLLFSYFFLFF